MIATDWIDLLIIALVPLDTEYTKYTEYTQKKKENIINQWQNYEQEAQLMLTTGSTRLLAVSRARAISDGTLT